MSAYGVWSIIISKRLSYFADLIGAISLEGFDGRGECFNELIHKIRPHGGQIKTAKNIRDLLFYEQPLLYGGSFIKGVFNADILQKTHIIYME